MGSGGSVAAFGLSTAATWGAADFAGGLATKGAAPTSVVAVAHGVSLVLLAAVALLLHSGPFVYVHYGLLSGVFCSAGLIALYSALSRGSMGLSAAISGVLSAIVPVLFSWFRESHPSHRQLAGFAVAAAAIWLVAYTREPGAGAMLPSRGLGLAICAGLCFGAMLVLMHLAAPQGLLNALISMRIASTAVAVSAGIAFWLVRSRRGSDAPRFPAGKLLLLAMLADVLDTTGNLLYLFASLAGRLDVVAVLASLYPAGTMLLAAWLLRERATRSQTVGMALALASVVLISF